MSDDKHTRQVYQLFDTPLYLKFIVWRSIIDYIANHSLNSDFLLYIFVEYLGNSLCQVSSISLMLHLTSLSPKLYVELKKDYFTYNTFLGLQIWTRLSWCLCQLLLWSWPRKSFQQNDLIFSVVCDNIWQFSNF